MKIITFCLMLVCIGTAQAVQVYKCPGKVEGNYTYQERPCPGAKADEHTLKYLPSDEKKIAQAQEKLARELEEAKRKEAQNNAAVAPPVSPLPLNPPPVSPLQRGDSAAPAMPPPANVAPSASTVPPLPKLTN